MDKENIENVAELSSQDLFSDEDHHVRDPNFQSPIFVKKNESLNSSVISLRTPILCSKVKEETPGKACVPKTPVALLPYIAKTNISWTSDMETPKTKLLTEMPQSCNKTANSVDIQCTPPKHLQSPNRENLRVNNMNITSPVLGGKKRTKRKAKRRILSNIASVDTDNNNEQTDSNTFSTDQADKKPPAKRTINSSSETASSVSNGDEVPGVAETENQITNCGHLEVPDAAVQEEEKEEAGGLDKNSNTSTQDFFCNASFSSIDKICSMAALEKKKQLNSNAGEIKNDIKLESIKEEVIDEQESKVTNSVSQDLLDRVAAIKRNQKSIRRSVDNNHIAIPKEAFHQSALNLELADINDINSTRMKLSQGNKKTQTVLSKPSKLGSFTSLAAIENEVIIKSEQLSIKQEEMEQDVPDEMMDDWNTQFIDDVENKGNLKRSLPVIDEPGDFDTGGDFCKANGQGIAISEKNLQKRLKIFHEIESEIKNSEDLYSIEKTNSKKIYKKPPNHIPNQIRLNNLQNRENIMKTEIVSTNNKLDMNINKAKDEFSMIKPSTSRFQKEKSHKINHSKKSEVLKLYEDLDLNEFLAPNFDSKSECSPNNSFSSEAGKSTKISDKTEKYHSKLCDSEATSDDSNVPTTASIPTTSKSSETNLSDGFSTAGGRNIAVSDDKENYYLNLYNQLNDTDEASLLNIKKNKVSKVHSKPTNKALIVFKNKENSSNSKITEPLITINIEKQSANIVSDGFATGSGKGIQVSEEKINHYKSIYNQLSENVTDENSLLVANKKKSYTSKSMKLETAPIVEQKSCDIDSKLQNNSDSDEAFYNLGDIEKLFIPQKQTESQNKNPTHDSTDFPKPDQSSTNVQQVQINTISSINKSEPTLYENLHQNILKNKQDKGNMGVILKRKLDNSEVKKPERCRSFGGFPVSNESVSASKLNKTDPQGEPSVNQPLQKYMSISQCFDSHSDSFLSKVELSFLNNSKTTSPDSKVEKSSESATMATDKCAIDLDQETEDFLGFSFKECVESYRLYIKFKRFLKKPSATEEFVFKVPDNRIEKQNNEVLNNEKVEKKRKLSYSDNESPLTTVKKPRVGCEVQGRRLFSDESDEENDGSGKKEVDNEPQPLEPPVIPQEEEETVEEEEDLKEKRFNALLLQEKLMRNKKRIKVKPTLGSLLKERLVNHKNRISWSQLVGDFVPKARSIEEIIANHPDGKVLEVTASNATCYKFLTANIVGHKKTASLDVGDGALLIFDENGHAGISEFTDAFLSMPGVDPKLIPTGWVENHYKWIIWKLASMDRKKFNSIQLPKMLTPERVMQELKYRYDREIDRAQRPALRKILEKDDVPSRRMVLCISSITAVTPNAEDTEKEVRAVLGLARWKIEVTDGWYSIPLTIDNAMANYVSIGKIKEGTKIVTYGAELLECERGFHPLDKPANVSLKIFTNSTRRARWDTKLGYCMNSKPIPIKLRDIIPSGGTIGETTAVAARVYPILYRERTADGQLIYRNARSEEKAAVAHERAVEKKLESMYAEAQKKFESKKQSDSDEETDNSQAKSQGKSWEIKCEKLKQQLESEVREGLPPQRQVTPVLKVRLVDDKTTVILTIWGANEDSNYDIKEGNTYTIYNSYAQGSRGGELNLTANRLTHIRMESLLKLPYSPRTCTLIPDIGGASFEPKFNELDTVGVVVSLGPAPHGMRNFEMVNLAYPKPNNSGSSYLTILFWDGVSSFGYQGTLTIGSFVACSNLEWRRNTSWSVAVVYCSEKTVFTCNPRQPHLDKEIRSLRALVKNPVTYAESCTEELTSELAKKPNPRSNQGTPTTWSGRKSFFNGASTSEIGFSPGNVAIQRRLERLSQYGTPSSNDVAPIVLDNSSRVNKGFTPVTRNNA